MNKNVKEFLTYLGLAFVNVMNNLFGKPEDRNRVMDLTQKLYVSA